MRWRVYSIQWAVEWDSWKAFEKSAFS